MIFTIKLGHSQNPLGIYIDIDGTLKFWEYEANLNGNLEDTVIVTCGSETYMDDLRNIKQIDLTLIETKRDSESTETNLDPSKINDATLSIWGSHLGDTNFFNWKSNLTPALIDSSYETNTLERKYSDLAIGDGLTDSVLQNVKSRLKKYVNQFYGTRVPYEASNKLHQELSDYDSIVDKVAQYDYLVDRVVFYDYNNQNQLIRVTSYHWNSGVEVDFITYDKTGNMIYFARESIGSIRNELFFTYDPKKRVVEVMKRYSSCGPLNITPHAHPDIRIIKFTYDRGVVSSISRLLDDGNWLTCYYEIK